MNKKGMYEVFEQHFNRDMLYQKILAKRVRKKRIIYCSVICVFGFILFSGVLFAKSFFGDEKARIKTDNVIEDQIFINEYETEGLYDGISDMDVQILPLSSSTFSTILLDAEIPQDLELQDAYHIYVKDDTKYTFHDMVECYLKGTRKVILAYSGLEEPLRDTKLPTGVMSRIDGVDVQISKWEEKYVVQFQYDDVYYDIECDYLLEEEVLTLVKSIIK